MACITSSIRRCALSGWPDSDRRSRIVFITRGILRGDVLTLAGGSRGSLRRLMRSCARQFQPSSRTSDAQIRTPYPTGSSFAKLGVASLAPQLLPGVMESPRPCAIAR